MAFQAAADGSIFDGDNPAHPTVDQRQELLEHALGSMGWTSTIRASQPAGRFVKFEADVSKTNVNLNLEIFIFPNLNWGNRPSRPYEKRIQITRPFAEHSVEFSRTKTGSDRCLLLGINRISDQETVICAWDASAYLNHAQPTSCYVDLHAIAEAFKSGFAQSIDSKGRYVCCFRPEFIHYYLANMEALHTPPGSADDNTETQPSDDTDRKKGGDNFILYGAPGTGKSHELNERVGDAKVIRTVFHPDIQNSDFIGALKPVTRDDVVSYEFSPGPFAKALKSAIMHPSEDVYLIIEELNRAPAAAVFGDLFLLLDRKAGGESVYDVSFVSEELGSWLNDGPDQEIKTMKLPSNLSILATMNSADQGVYPLDTAFRRRWKQDYLKIDYRISPEGTFNVATNEGAMIEIPWKKLAKTLNQFLVNKLNVAEDRLIGPRFISEEDFSQTGHIPGKILIYLWDDLLRHQGRDRLFDTSVAKTYGNLFERLQSNRKVFSEEFLAELSTVIAPGLDNK